MRKKIFIKSFKEIISEKYLIELESKNSDKILFFIFDNKNINKTKNILESYFKNINMLIISHILENNTDINQLPKVKKLIENKFYKLIKEDKSILFEPNSLKLNFINKILKEAKKSNYKIISLQNKNFLYESDIKNKIDIIETI